MAQVIKKEKIGQLTYGAGTITLAASILTIGGQQYTTNALNLTVPTIAANTLYMIYAVQTAGVISLVQSTNVNSIGPVGYLSWKLVGAYYSNGVAVPVFGSFVDISSGDTSDWIDYTLVVTAFSGTLTNFNVPLCQYKVKNGSLWLRGQLQFSGAVGTWSFPRFSAPTNFTMTYKANNAVYTPSVSYIDVGNGTFNGLFYVTPTYIECEAVYGANGQAVTVSQAAPFAFGATDVIAWAVEDIEIANWNQTAIKDR